MRKKYWLRFGRLVIIVLILSAGYISIACAEGPGVEFYEKQMKQMMTMFGQRHPNTLKSMNSLAVAYFKAERYEDAAAMDVKTLSLRREVLGERHPETLISMSNLANDYYALGNLQSLNLLANEYGKLERYQDAAALLERTLALARKKFGETDPTITLLRRNLGVYYYNLRRYQDAAILDEATLKVLRARQESDLEQLLTMESVNTAEEIIMTMKNLANDYRALGNLEKATAIEKELEELE